MARILEVPGPDRPVPSDSPRGAEISQPPCALAYNRRSDPPLAPPGRPHMPIRPYLDTLPTLDARVYVDPAAVLIGDVVLGADVSLWPGTIVRGDVNFIRIGARTN